MRSLLTLCCAVSMACLLVSGCNFVGARESVGQIGGARTWIDAPLDGSTIPFAPYQIVLHAYDPSGVTQIELNANGTLLATLPNPNPGQPLTTLKYLWSPAGAGNYTLSARAQSSNGLSGSEATAVVTVIGAIVMPVFTAPGPTGSPAPVPTLSPTPPTPLAALTFAPRISDSQFYYGGCTPNQVTIQVLVSGGSVSSVVLFSKLKDQSTGAATNWDEGSDMRPSSDGWFSRTINASSVQEAEGVSAAWLLYQFVAMGSAGQIIGRSQVYSDIALSACSAPAPGIIVPPLRRFITPSPTLIPPPK